MPRMCFFVAACIVTHAACVSFYVVNTHFQPLCYDVWGRGFIAYTRIYVGTRENVTYPRGNVVSGLML